MPINNIEHYKSSTGSSISYGFKITGNGFSDEFICRSDFNIFISGPVDAIVTIQAKVLLTNNQSLLANDWMDLEGFFYKITKVNTIISDLIGQSNLYQRVKYRISVSGNTSDVNVIVNV